MTTHYRIVERTFSLVGGGERKTWYPQYKPAWWPFWWNFNNHSFCYTACRNFEDAKMIVCEQVNGTIDRVVFEAH